MPMYACAHASAGMDMLTIAWPMSARIHRSYLQRLPLGKNIKETENTSHFISHSTTLYIFCSLKEKND